MRFFTSFGTLIVLLIAGFFTILADGVTALFPGIKKSNTSPRPYGA